LLTLYIGRNAALPNLIGDATLKTKVAQLVDEAVAATRFARDWRDRRIAHRDLKLALEQPTTPLAQGSRADVRKALQALAAVLNAVASHYLKAQTAFDMGAAMGAANSLLYVLEIGAREREAEQKRLEEIAQANDELAAKKSQRRTMVLAIITMLCGFGLWVLTPVIWLFTVYLAYLASFRALLAALFLPFLAQLYWIWTLWNEKGTVLNLFTVLCLAWIMLAVTGIIARTKVEMS
jgi:HEPN superfamily AbiU2-like protein